jgi:integrase
MLRIPAELEKGNKDRLLPMAPEFATFLAAVPEAKRHGYVFNPKAQRDRSGRLGEQQVGRVVSTIGEKAGVVVNPQRGTAPTETEPASADYKPAKYASAHDLRRSFGERWASKVMPQVLMELMRHESIETTMKFYVGRNAQTTAAVLWEAVKDHEHRQPSASPLVSQPLSTAIADQ